MECVIEAMRNRIAILVTDISCNKTIAPTVKRVGWLLYCTTKKQKLCKKSFEQSARVECYQAELLGLLSIHMLCTVLEEVYEISEASGKICCNNRGARTG